MLYSNIQVAATAKSLQSCLTLCDPIDGSPPGFPVPGILQARILEWVAISFSNACMHDKSLQSYLTLCDPMDTAHQAPLSLGFSRQEYWTGLPFLLYIYRRRCLLRYHRYCLCGVEVTTKWGPAQTRVYLTIDFLIYISIMSVSLIRHLHFVLLPVRVKRLTSLTKLSKEFRV